MDRFSERVTITPRKFTRDRIEQYISIARSGFSDKHGLEIKAEHENIEIPVSSIEELVSHERIPDQLRNLTIRIWEPKGYINVHQIEKDIDFSIDSLGAHLAVEGIDETWVVGMKERIQKLFDESRPRRDKLVSFLRHKITSSIVLGLWLVVMVRLIFMINIVQSFLLSIASIYLLFLYIDWIIWGFTGGYRVILRKSHRQILGMTPKEYIPILISILILLVNGVQIAINLIRSP